MSATLLDKICESMDASLRGLDGSEPPVAMLWTDPDGQWLPLIPALMKVIPRLFALGAYSPDKQQGPVIWLKCVVDRTLPDIGLAEGTVPILYLPNVSRQTLRSADDCESKLQPLVELQYRGTVWHHRNGRDWTVEAFLSSDDGVGLDVARNAVTREAVLRVLPQLATEPVAVLIGRKLEAEDFDRLLISDPVRDLLKWISDNAAFEASCDRERWVTFCNVCAREFDFDPEKDGLRSAASALTAGFGKWNDAWSRFREAPSLYPGIPTVLRDVPPRDLLQSMELSRQPLLNEMKEDQLRAALKTAAELPHADACDKVEALDDEHGERRKWVWAQIGESPYVQALEPLGRLARESRCNVSGTSVGEFVADYTERGWRCDWAAIEAFSKFAPGEKFDLVANVVRALYVPWLERGAQRFQELLSAGNADPSVLVRGVEAEPGTCILFADGLRFDIGAVLSERLVPRGIRVNLGYRITAVPTVTATAKPLASPAHKSCVGTDKAEDFCPAISGDGKPATTARLRALIANNGIIVPDAGVGEVPMGLDSDAIAWIETGSIDRHGHSLNVGLARQVNEEIGVIANRVDALLAAGWRRVRVVTDHGWLLLAGGLPKVELPPSLVETKWARCAAVRGESSPAIPTYPWYWNPLLRIASPPGIGSFYAGTDYAHGGVSPQECIVPDLIAERDIATDAARITNVDWRGMRCRVTVKTNASQIAVDLRLNRKQPKSSIAASVPTVNEAGEASLLVVDDQHEGGAALIVVLDKSGRMLDDRPTTVGDGT